MLDFDDRKEIEKYLRGKWAIRAIARRLGRDHGVILREVARNKLLGEKRYLAELAQKRTDGRSRKKGRKRKLSTDVVLKSYVRRKLALEWSPQQVAERIKVRPPLALGGRSVSHEAIYQYIYDGPGKEEGWYHYLRRGQKRRRKHFSRKAQNLKIPERISIHARPEEINQRTSVGHWESDTMCFRKQKKSLSTQYERKTMLARLHIIENKTAEETERALRRSIESLPAGTWQSITFDNGGEGANHVSLRHDYGLMTYFCDTYASWQKGGVENQNGLTRQYLPRKTDMSLVTEAQVHAIQERLNDRPRKKLGYLTPNEAFAELLRGGALIP